MAETSPILKPCLNCGVEFRAKYQWEARRHQLHCGKACYRAYQNRLEHRQPIFWAQVDKTPSCWLWTGWKLNSGYGETTIRGRKITAHRLAYTWAYGQIPKGKLLMHTCDTPLCVRPDHLRIGTDADNRLDAMVKLRHQYGEKHAKAILTDALVTEIRALKGKLPQREIAARYGVSQSSIGHIMTGRTWRHL